MKTLALPVCLAVAAVAAMAELKDPAVVAADWNEAMAQTREPILSPGTLGLNATSPAPRFNFMPRNALIPKPPTAAVPPWGRSHPREPLLDAPHNRAPDVLPDNLPPGWEIDPKIQKWPGTDPTTPPPGAKPWYYRGQKFWLVPIALPTAPAEK